MHINWKMSPITAVKEGSYASHEHLHWHSLFFFISCIIGLHDAVIKWSHFHGYWPFVREIHPSGTSKFPTQKPVTRIFDFFFNLRLNKRLNKQSRGCWFETPPRPFWRHCNTCICATPATRVDHSKLNIIYDILIWTTEVFASLTYCHNTITPFNEYFWLSSTGINICFRFIKLIAVGMKVFHTLKYFGILYSTVTVFHSIGLFIFVLIDALK